MRAGGKNYGTCHSFEDYLDRFWEKNPKRPELFEEEHPEYFAKVLSGRPPQMCYSSPELVKQVVRDARKAFDQGAEFFPVVPNDSPCTVCRCAACQTQMDMSAGKGFFTSGQASVLIWNFINQVAREVRKTHPDRYIATLAYRDYAWYPKGMEIERNVLVGPCLHTANWWSPAVESVDVNLYTAWQRKCKGRLQCMWLYECFPMEGAINGKFKHFPGFHGHTIAKQMKQFGKDGVLGIDLCGTAQYIDGYLTYRLMDDPSQDVDRMLNEFFKLYYGPAAKPMKKFYLLVEETYMNKANYPANIQSGKVWGHQTKQIAWEYLGTQERMEELASCLELAKRLAADGPEEQRVLQFEKDVWRHMVLGRRQARAAQ